MENEAVEADPRGLTRRALVQAALVAAATPQSLFAKTGRKPNFVFIMADDLGAFDLSCYGNQDIATPNIDSLARDGLKFSHAYANSSSCAPTRTALISGKYQNRQPVGTGMGGAYPSATIGYPADLPSLPGVLKQAGYRTCLVGKWDLGELPTFSPNKSGYDEFMGFMGGGIDYWRHDLESMPGQPARRPDFYRNEQQVSVEGYATDLFSNEACDFISRNAASPFLLSLHYNAPHWPWQTGTDKALNRLSDFHFDGGSPAIYKQMVEEMDAGIGRVLRTIREKGLQNDTIVVFTSDNGGERFSKMWPLRGAKGDLWEGGVRVPLLIRWPGCIKRGAQSPQVAMSMDFLPTFAALAGAPVSSTDGIDLSRHLSGADPVSRTVFWKTPGDMVSALSYPWKYLRIGKREFLYNLEVDETEHANFKRSHPDHFARLKSEAEAWAAQMLKDLPAPPAAYLDALEALDRPSPI